jgi:hypothetical protein
MRKSRDPKKERVEFCKRLKPMLDLRSSPEKLARFRTYVSGGELGLDFGTTVDGPTNWEKSPRLTQGTLVSQNPVNAILALS